MGMSINIGKKISKLKFFIKEIEIIFDGFVPELFQENMGVILDGVFDKDTFIADDMLVKHDNEYVSSDGETYNVENYSE